MRLPLWLVDKNSRPYHALFLFILAGVVAYKFNDLFLPYFWDELGVYSQCAYYQYLHGLSLMPASVPPGLSRGHPLLFTFCNAVIFKTFGPHVFCAHLFNLSIALSLLILVYISATKYFGSVSAIISCIFMALQPIFLAQSCLVLPEMMLALFTFCALLCFYQERFFLFALFSSLAMLTKETAVIIPAVVITYSLARFLIFRKKQPALTLLNVFWVLSPYLVFGSFLLTQKMQNGWYFFPYHLEHMSLSFDHRFFDFIFLSQGRRYWYWAVIVGLVFLLFKKGVKLDTPLLLMTTLVTIFVIFSSLNFFMERYTLMALVPFAIIAGALISHISENKILLGILVIILVAISYPDLEPDGFNYDADMGYRKQVHTTQSAINYVDSISDGKKTVYANFPVYCAISFPGGGYLHDNKIKAVLNFKGRVDYFIYSNPGDMVFPDTVKNKMTVLQTFKESFTEVTVYSLEKK